MSNFIYYISFFLAFTETYDLATLVDNPTQLPRHYHRMSLYLSQKFQPNIFVPISARTEVLVSGKAYTNVTTVPLGSISDPPLVELGTT